MLALHPRVVDAVWTAIEALIPVHRPKPHLLGCHRRRISDRVCFEGILRRLVTGCSGDVAGRISGAGETTLRRRREEWTAAGVFATLRDEALAGYDRIIGLDLTDVAVDGSQHQAPFGGEGTGPNPTDRGTSGWKWSIATDREGIPFGWAIEGANRNDGVLFQPTITSIIERGLLTDIETMPLDRGSTTTSCAATALRSALMTSSAPGAVSETPRPRNSRCRSGCAGRSNPPTAGSRTSGSYAPTPTGSCTTVSPKSISPSS